MTGLLAHFTKHTAFRTNTFCVLCKALELEQFQKNPPPSKTPIDHHVLSMIYETCCPKFHTVLALVSEKETVKTTSLVLMQLHTKRKHTMLV